ncbi:hypoxanthine phosphoribosyltransferase [Pseudopedobacter beijingensis]|uniref:Hypoxanthine phosphoribosyltransferase n=1 Tax=Pseudopedobacter beijingensis TaxID=1207056 RepID=A0ABW4IBJ9_9SPHI
MDLTVNDKVFEPFIDYKTIENRIKLLAIQINKDYEGKTPLFVGILNGSFMFLADLMKEVSIPCEISFMKVSSYEAMSSTGNIKEHLSLTMDIENRDIVLVEDIIESGNTLKYLIESLEKRKPKSIKVASLLFKTKELKHTIAEIEYIGFEIASDFVVGYGLDYDGLGRNTKNIYKLKN